MFDGYMTKELLVIAHRTDEGADPNDYGANFFEKETYAENKYIIFVVLKGNALVQNGDKILKMHDNQLLLVDTNTTFGYNFAVGKMFSAFIIRVHPSLFVQYDDKDFLRAFYRLSPDERVFSLNSEPHRFIRQNIISLNSLLQLKVGRDHLMPRINTIISMCALHYDRLHATKNEATDSMHVRIIDYINRHFHEAITYKSISDLFFSSPSTISRIVEYYYNMTLHQYIERLRLHEAKNNLENPAYKEVSIRSIAELSGFHTYSTFYRAFKRVYGISPTKVPTTHDRPRLILPYK